MPRRRKKMGRATSALWGRLGRDATAATLVLLTLALPLAAVPPASSRWPGIPGDFFVGGGGFLLLCLLRRTGLRGAAAQALGWARRGPTPWLLGWLAWSAVSALAGGDRRWALPTLAEAGAGLAVWGAAASQTGSRRLRLLLDALIGAAGLASVLTIIAVLALGGIHALTDSNGHLVVSGQTHLPRFHTQIASAGGEPAPAGQKAGPFGDPHFLSAFLILSLPLLLAVAGSPSRRVRRLAAGGAAAAGIGALAVAGALPFAWPGLVAGMGALGVLSLRHLPRRGGPSQGGPDRGARAHRPRSARLRPGSREYQRARMREAFAAFPLAPALTTLGVALCLTWVGLHEWRQTAPAVAAAAIAPTSAARLEARDGERSRRTALSLARQRPLFGWGPGSFPLRQKAQTGLGHDAAFLRRHGPDLSDQAHSFYLQTAAEAGLPALVFWLGGLGAFFLRGGRALRRLPAGSLRGRALAGALAGVAAQAADALFDPAWQYGQIQFYLWLILGMAIACTAGDGGVEGDAAPPTPPAARG